MTACGDPSVADTEASATSTGAASGATTTDEPTAAGTAATATGTGDTGGVPTTTSGPSVDTGEPGDTGASTAVTGETDATEDTGGTGDTGDTDTGEPPGSFWHIEGPVDGGRTWLVSPTGEKTFMLGVNTVMRAKECEGVEDFITRVEPTRAARIEWARLGTGQSGEESVAKPYCFNSVGAFSESNDFDGTKGDSYMIRPFAAGGAEAPYSVVVYTSASSDEWALRDFNGEVLESGVSTSRFGDPFNPKFLAQIDAVVKNTIVPRKNDPNLQIWYLDNEIGVFDKGGKGIGVRDYRRYLWSNCAADSTIDAPQCARHALAGFLRERYGSDLAALNKAWESKYVGADFTTIVDVGPRPIPYVSDCNQQCRVDLQIFVHDVLLRTWVREITTRVRAADPNHIISSPRMALGTVKNYRFWTPASAPTPDVWIEDGKTAVPSDTAEVKYNPIDLMARDGDAGYDMVAFNVYEGLGEFAKPWFTDGVHRVQEMTGLPIIISEFGIRARIDGWLNVGGAFSFVSSNDNIEDQAQRGDHYQSQLEQFYGFKGIVGVNWHAWTDRYLTDPTKERQMNMGLFRCEVPKSGHKVGERWPEIDTRVAATNCNIMKLIEAKTGL